MGLERAGMETIAFCENDKKARLVLQKHWPDVPIFEDVKTLTYEKLKKLFPIDLISGGFPCQPFSVAGKQRGNQDDRHLWPEYFRLIQEIGPRWVIGENVAGLINLGLDEVLSDLDSANFSCQTVIVPACAITAPHRRDRVWIVAHTKSERVQGSGAIGQQESEAHGGAGLSLRGGAERIGDFWAIEPQLARVADGIPNRVDRLKQLGNAVVPQVVEILGRAIMEMDKGLDKEV